MHIRVRTGTSRSERQRDCSFVSSQTCLAALNIRLTLNIVRVHSSYSRYRASALSFAYSYVCKTVDLAGSHIANGSTTYIRVAHAQHSVKSSRTARRPLEPGALAHPYVHCVHIKNDDSTNSRQRKRNHSTPRSVEKIGRNELSTSPVKSHLWARNLGSACHPNHIYQLTLTF